MGSQTFTRQELYDLVWSKPMMLLGQQLQLSDNGLRKICRKYAIPVPKMGHWQKVRYGKPPRRAALPAYEGNDSIAIKILPRIKESLNPSVIVEETITVPETVTTYHPLVLQTRKILRQKGHEYHGRFYANRGESALDIAVSRKQLARAYMIMDTILKAVERYGGKITVEGACSYALLDGEKVGFELDELMTIIKKEADPLSFATYEYIPKGKLVFKITEYLGGCQSKWTEGENTGLENKLTPIVNGLFFAAAYLKKERKEREERQRKREEERRAEIQRLQQIEEEKRRREALENQVVLWQKSLAIHEFIQAAIAKQGEYPSDSKFAEWVAWATAYANDLNPLRKP